jgi:hypothetical protein
LRARIIRLGPGECPDIETGARYFAALAFPGTHEESARRDAVAAWVARYLHEANCVDETDAPFADDRLNAFAGLSPDWCRAKLRTVDRRLRDRAELARAVRPWIRDALGEPHGPVSGIAKFTQRQISLWLTGEGSPKGDPVERGTNFQKRVWRPGRPVLHVAVAQDLVLCLNGSDETSIDLDLGAVTVIAQMVERAEIVAGLIVQDSRFMTTGDELLRLEWVP